MIDPIILLVKGVLRQSPTVSADTVRQAVSGNLSMDDFNILQRHGVSSSDLTQVIADSVTVNYERVGLFREIDNAIMHPLIASAAELYADIACTYSTLQNATVWATGDAKYVSEIGKLFDRINLEERIFDWAWSTATYGDLIPKVNAQPGLGVVSVEDSQNPVDISRVDVNGILVGWYETPLGDVSGTASQKLQPPWDYCLRGDTEIKLLDGTFPTIQYMSEHRDDYIGRPVLSINPDTLMLEPDKIVEVKKTRIRAALVRVWLDNGEHVDCTPDHKFMLRDGTYKPAGELVENESLMPLHYKISNQFMPGYEVSYNPGKNRWRRTHNIVADYSYGIVQRKSVVHHRDFCITNNNPSNLQVMTSIEHHAYHNSINHPDSCNCVVCQQRRGEWKRADHTDACMCPFCRMARGEFTGENHPRWIPRETRVCACGCETPFECKINSTQTYLRGHWMRGRRQDFSGHTLDCQCTRCKAMRRDTHTNFGFNGIITKTCPYCGELFKDIKAAVYNNHLKSCKHRAVVLNHKVVSVEILTDVDDVYDIETERNHNFPLKSGVFVHNCHLRILGAKRKRSVYGDTSANDYRTTYLITKDSRRITAKYGTSVLVNALPIYKRLRLCEDSLILARLTRGVLRYLYKLKVTGDNAEAIATMIGQYKSILKHARAVDITEGAGNGGFKSQFSPMSALTDLLIPIWGDTDDLAVEELGGKPDIKWIVDIEELRNQLSCALRVPLPLLGGYTSEASGALGASTMEQLDIRFSRSCRRIQRAIIDGLTRLCQINFAYMGMSPDVSMFELHMPETSTVEEEQLKKSLLTGMEVISSVMDVLETVDQDIDKAEVFSYLNEKILKLNDFDLSAFMKASKVTEEQISTFKNEDMAKFVKEARLFMLGKQKSKRPRYLPGDTRSALPTKEGISKVNALRESGSKKKSLDKVLNEDWHTRFGKTRIKIKTTTHEKE